MRFATARRRLRHLPEPLPEGPEALTPVAVLDARGRPTGLVRPSWPVTRVAAGLVLLYPDAAGEARVVLIRRPDGEYRHSGEIGLPGGAAEADDPSPEATALREAIEEVGLDEAQAGLHLIGRLDPVEVRVSGFRLLPILALADREPRLAADPYEVAEILRLSVDHFLPGAPIVQLELVREGWHLRYGAFPAGGLNVWGATGRVMGQLGALLGR